MVLITSYSQGLFSSNFPAQSIAHFRDFFGADVRCSPLVPKVFSSLPCGDIGIFVQSALILV
uniref:Uncharacterized protein n=1 Tax=Arion vulgaris TaxID=1028688 RepID=A0A0B7B5Z9_9EUPU